MINRMYLYKNTGLDKETTYKINDSEYCSNGFGACLGEFNLSIDCDYFLQGLSALSKCTDANKKELWDNLDETITKCIKLVLSKQRKRRKTGKKR